MDRDDGVAVQEDQVSRWLILAAFSVAGCQGHLVLPQVLVDEQELCSHSGHKVLNGRVFLLMPPTTRNKRIFRGTASVKLSFSVFYNR